MADSSSESKMVTAKAVFSAAASVTASIMLARTLANDLLPHEFQEYFFSGVRNFFSQFSSQVTVVIEEFDGLVNNQIYEAAQVYLSTKISPSTRRLKVSKPEKENNFNVSMETNEEVIDVFNGVKVKWILASRRVESGYRADHGMNSSYNFEVRFFELSFHLKHQDMVINSYLPHIVEAAKSLRQEKKTLKLFTPSFEHMYGNLSDAWTPVNLDHPATFETLAMELEIKKTILEDLERFVKRRDYYRRVGKAWKRGYLLYGPPGTGKSSLVAAMANYLNFDIYDLELTELRCNSDLRRLLVATANRSILVVEDIDCTIEFHDRAAEARATNFPPGYAPEKQVTLSGLLNFIDGLWSSCGDERIIVFTTNHKEKLDAALLRPGRMDVHVHMSYCTPCGFKLLAANYLGVKEHILFGEIEDLVRTAEVTPAEVAEQLLKGRDQPDDAFRDMIEFLKSKKKENEELKAKKVQEELEEKKRKEEEKEKKRKEEEEMKGKDGKTDNDDKSKLN
ncbi:AAA-ATPase At3g50940-like [Punica granatum]|uniref:AAA+ ATPase domain-containing protein n=2 Tax=Punica granatum TaxID=22663 RepID=A0A218WQ90_PUNGR|nr:AAA-ATPase At3g50940-like [Punica granatum]OWM74659.1 hypothetical protein CDL15_Pgr005239 [Punica granatum]PKI54978.1 hypothetical protein CRG98_024650 [Punica granatum]